MKIFGYLRTLVAFSYRRYPWLFACIALGLFSAAVELLAMSYLLPISALASGAHLSQDSLPVRIVTGIGLPIEFRVMLFAFVVLLLLRIITQALAQGLTSLLTKQLHAELSSLAFSSTISVLSLRTIEEKSVGHFMSLAGDEANRASMLVFTLNQFASAAVLALLYFVTLTTYSVDIGLGVLAFLLFTLLCLADSFLRAQRLAARQLGEAKLANSFFIDALNNLRSVRAFEAEKYVSAGYRERIVQWSRTGFQVDMLSHLGRVVPALFLLVAFGLWLALGSEIDKVDFAFVVTIVIFLLRFFPVVGQCLNLFMRVLADARPAHDISEVLDLVRLKAPAQGGSISSPVDVIELKDIDFSYDGAAPIIEKLRAKFVRGRSYAITGPSGSGKSTLADLLVRFYDVGSGKILINGTDLASFSASSVREHILVLGQRTAIFNDTAWNNIALGAQVSEWQMRRACEIACVDEVIRSMPNGYQSALSYQGSNLSGGQLQRIGIARALLRDTDVLILDESTSALDQDVRERILEGILLAYRDRIVIFVTHDAFVVSRVDEIVSIAPPMRGVARKQIARQP